jgi:hypothetical protein
MATEVLFPRQLSLDVGGLNPQNHRTMDYELWGRLLLAGARFEYTGIPFGIFRIHGQQKTFDGWKQTQSLIATATWLVGASPDLSDRTRREILAELRAHEAECWRNTGRLATLGLPRGLVTRLRQLRAKLRGGNRPVLQSA